jgi:hypothetical protein
VVHFLQNVLGELVIGKEVLSHWTNEYQACTGAFARNHSPTQWAQPKMRKENCVRPALHRMERAGQHDVYFILLKSTEQGKTFRAAVPSDSPTQRAVSSATC